MRGKRNCTRKLRYEYNCLEISQEFIFFNTEMIHEVQKVGAIGNLISLFLIVYITYF